MLFNLIIVIISQSILKSSCYTFKNIYNFVNYTSVKLKKKKRTKQLFLICSVVNNRAEEPEQLPSNYFSHSPKNVTLGKNWTFARFSSLINLPLD